MHTQPMLINSVLLKSTGSTQRSIRVGLSGYVQVYSIPCFGRNLPRTRSHSPRSCNTTAQWNPEKDAKLSALQELLTQTHPDDKILVFTQFADTVQYLTDALSEREMTRIAAATGDSADPTALAHRFSPVSNDNGIALIRKTSYGCSSARMS